MGDAEANKATVQRYLDAMRRGDPSLPELLSDDVSWWVPPSSPLGGLREGKSAVLALMASGVGLYDASVPFEVDVQAMTAEEDRVAVELTMRARTAKGAPYFNHYHFAFRLRDGRICAVKEYVDTLAAQRLLFD